MKVLSLLQPWATLVVIGAKKFECRSWNTNYRGPIIIHASGKKPSRREKLFFRKADFFRNYIDDMDYLPFGPLIGKVILKEIFRTEWLLQNLEVAPKLNWEQELAFDDYSSNRYAWQLEEAEAFSATLPIKGRLGLGNTMA